jgi:hypothetical protein
MKSHQAQRKKW